MMYEKANAEVVTGFAEGVFMASGEPNGGEASQCLDEGKYDSYNEDREACAVCSATRGAYFKWQDASSNLLQFDGYNNKDFKNMPFQGCPANLPRGRQDEKHKYQ